MPDDPDDPDESFIIQTVLSSRPSDAAPVAVPGTTIPPVYAPGDDAACLPGDTVVTVDAMVEGVHWDEKLSPADVGWKLVAANASDINAMGATPLWAVLTLCVPHPANRAWIEDFAKGLGEALTEWSIQLVGGDTTRSDKRMVSMTLTGTTANPIGRSGAQIGDDIWVSGRLGGAAAAFFVPDADGTPLRRPCPPIGLGQALGQLQVVSSMMDLSDGLRQDLPKLCRASGVGAVIEPDRVPKHESLNGVPNSFALAVGFGEEYELLFTAPPAHRDAIIEAAKPFCTNLTRVGIIQADAGSGAVLNKGRWPDPLFTHFPKVTG